MEQHPEASVGSPVHQGPASEREGDRTTSSLSWVVQLQLYLRATQGSLGSQVAMQRKVLGDVVLDNPNAAQAWLNFLQHEESITESLASSTCYIGSKKLSLMYWYQKATELVQRSKGQAAEAYVSIWLGYARHQWASNEDEARDTFKTLRNLQIASSCARLYHDWAVLEARAGKVSKALGILNKGLSEQAQPQGLLTSLMLELQQQQQGGEPTGPTAALPPAAASQPGSSGDTMMLAAAGATCNLTAPHLSALCTAGQSLLASDAPGTAQRGIVPQVGSQLPSSYLQPHTERAVLAPANHTQHSGLSGRSGGGGTSMGAAMSHEGPHMQQTVHLGSRSGVSMLSCSDEDATVSCNKGSDGSLTLTSSVGEDTMQHRTSGPHTAVQAAAGAGSSSTGGGGNNTGNVSAAVGAGIKRFGFKSKALRVTSTSASPVETPPAAAEPAAPAGAPAAVAAMIAPGSVPLPMCTDAEVVGDAQGTRKRRCELMAAATSPSSLNPAAVLPDGTKRRSSPDAAASRVDASVQHQPHTTLAVAPSAGQAAAVALSAAGTGAQQPLPVLQPPAQAQQVVHDENRAPPSTQPQHGTQGKAVPPPPLFNGTPSAFACVPASMRAALQPLATASGSSPPGAALPAVTVQAAAAAQGQQGVSSPRSSGSMAVGALMPQHAGPAASAQAPAVAAPSTSHGHSGEQMGAGSWPQQQPQAQPQVQQQQQQQQQVVGAPPERLPDVQRRAMEDANWVYVSGLRYQKLDCVGRGGSSKVFKVLGCNRQIYALKRVRMSNKDPEAIRGFIDEIALLKQLRHTPNIIQLISAQVFREEGLIYMVLEYGDIDLARLLHNHEEARRQRAAAQGGPPDAGGMDENFIRLYWQQMLQAVHGIHELRIVHSDLKPANFMLVQGQLKLIDFGIAKSIQGDTTSISRESQVGTLNYMSPEAIQGGTNNPLGGPSQKVGRPSDVWSLGCILYQMIYGRTPFADLPFIPKMNAICNPAHAITFPACTNPAAVDVMRACLDRNARTRATLQELLQHPFLHPERALALQPAVAVGAVPAPAPPASARGPGPMDGQRVDEATLKSIVTQIAQAGASGVVDIEHLTRQVLQQLTAGGGPPAAAMAAGAAAAPPAAAGAGQAPHRPPPPPPPPGLPPPVMKPQAAPRVGPPPPPPPPPPPAPVLGPKSMAGVAAAAAAAAAARLAAGGISQTSVPRRVPAPQPQPQGILGLNGAELQAAILQQRSSLRPVAHADPSSNHGSSSSSMSQQRAGQLPPPAAPGLEAILRKGLQQVQQQQPPRDDDTEFGMSGA